MFSSDIQGIHDIGSKETIEILVAIELHLEKQIKQIRSFTNKNVVEEQVRMHMEVAQSL